MTKRDNPGPLTVEHVVKRMYSVKSDWMQQPGRFEDVYVNFSGHFGSYGPHMFAAAPEMLDVLRKELEFIEEERRWSQTSDLSKWIERSKRLEAIIDKAEGRTE